MPKIFARAILVSPVDANFAVDTAGTQDSWVDEVGRGWTRG